MKKVLWVVVVLSLLATLPLAAGTEAKGPNMGEGKMQPGPHADAMQAYALAAQLKEYGEAHKSGLALLLAAQVLRDFPAQAAALKKTPDAKTAEKTEKETPKTEKKPGLTRDVLLAQARTYAGKDKDLLAMISAEEKQGDATRSPDAQRKLEDLARSYGVNVSVARVRARGSDIYALTFPAGEKAMVVIAGDGDTDLDLYVRDENGGLIGSSTGRSDDCVVEWYPRWTGRFTVEVRNPGSVYNEYDIFTTSIEQQN